MNEWHNRAIAIVMLKYLIVDSITFTSLGITSHTLKSTHSENQEENEPIRPIRMAN